ncbi:MAG: DUF1800 family protein, partial [Chitinophagaceae bacterium]|nr:DUF1800 family protein [Chitinophagaceae bacterium]
FAAKDGNIEQVLITMVSSPEFWSKTALREKTKSPFELAMSAVRSLNARIAQPYQVFTWLDKMGQKLYFYQAPTGFPDRGQYWINTGSLLNRMNFGLALVQHRIPGMKVDLLALNNGHEPESTESALATYAKLLMPERDINETVKRLTPLLNDPDLEKKVRAAAGTATPDTQRPTQPGNEQMQENGKYDALSDEDKMVSKGASGDDPGKMATEPSGDKTVVKTDKNMLTQVVGIIIGSPEFQRR